jgi:hypothetical protein
MEPTNRKIQSLVDMLIDRELLLPEMQRKYVWRATQVRDLLDSIYRDYPSGSILIWETDNLPIVKTHSFEKTGQSPIGKRLLLLDGQQRITSLATILTGGPIRIKEGTKIKEKVVEIYFNIDHPEDGGEETEEDASRFEVGDLVEAKWDDGEFYTGKILKSDSNQYFILYDDGSKGWTGEVRGLSEENKKQLYFQVRNRAVESKPNWIPVTQLFQKGVGAVLRDLKVGADHVDFDKYNQRLNQLYNRKESYLYPIQIIRDKSYGEVTDIFIRVNSSGTRLRSSDLALAQITSAWPGSMYLFETFVDKCVQKDFYIDENFLARCLICIATKQAKFENIGRMSAEKLKDAWELTKKGVQKTVNFLKNSALVDSSALLPSPILLVPLVCHASKSDLSETPKSEKGFLSWFYNAAIWARYSGSMESKLTQDLATLSSARPWVALTENIWQSVGKDRKVEPSDFRGKGVNSPLFFMMYVLARKNKARDLETGDVINYANFGKSNTVEYDHLFPKSKLETFLKEKDVEKSDRKRTINEIANMAFLTKQGNIIKTNEDPASYFPKVYKRYDGEQLFRQQQIPYDERLLSYDGYEDFLNERARRLALEANSFLEELK